VSRPDPHESERPVDEQGEELQPAQDANLVQQPEVGYVPVEERGGAISVSEGDAGPVGAIAVLASAALRGAKLEAEETLVRRAFGLRE
jgi:hypothetical protein